MTANDGLIAAYILDGRGGGSEIGWNEIRAWTPEKGVLWVHLDLTAQGTRVWLDSESGLDGIAVQSLLADETRPRGLLTPTGLIVNLRGVNLNPGADPEDMVSIRLWLDETRIISTRRRQLLSMNDLRAAFDRGQGPTDSSSFLATLADRLAARMADVIDGLDERIDTLDEQMEEGQETAKMRSEIAALRYEAIVLRRYLAPQREAMTRLYTDRIPWITDDDRALLREVADRTMRYIEELDAVRERAALAQENISNRLAEDMNRRMYVLSIVAAIFLPLGFLTGLLGVNVAGIPGTEWEWAFLLVCIASLGLAGLGLLLFRRRGWF